VVLADSFRCGKHSICDAYLSKDSSRSRPFVILLAHRKMPECFPIVVLVNVDYAVVKVVPSKEQYEANIYEGIHLQLAAFVVECHDDMMVNTHKRNREMGEGKLKFEASITHCLSPF